MNISGFELDLTSDADIVLKSSGQTLFFECKRPNKLSALRNNISRASKQLKKRYDMSGYATPKYGVIVVSLEKILNPYHYRLIVDDENDIKRIMENMVLSFIDKYKLFWSMLNNNELIGVLFFFKTFALLKAKHMLSNCQYMAMHQLCRSGSYESILISHVVKRIRENL